MTSTGGESGESGKDTPPLDVRLVLDGSRIVPGIPFGATFSWAPKVPVAAVRTRVEVVGALGVEGGTGDWLNVEAGRLMTVPTRLVVSGQGLSEVHAVVEVLDAAGALLFGRTATLYLLTTGNDVLTGTTGALDLRLRQLDADRAAGRLSAEVYLRQRERVLGGGATDTRG